MMNNTAKSSRN